MSSEKIRAWRKEHGLCKSCGDPVKPGYVRCETCLHIKRIKQREYRIKYSEVLRERRRIADAKEKRKEQIKRSAQKTYARYRAEGLCVNCGKPAEDGKCRCAECRIKNSAKQKKAYQNLSDERKEACYSRQQSWRKDNPERVEEYKKRRREGVY